MRAGVVGEDVPATFCRIVEPKEYLRAQMGQPEDFLSGPPCNLRLSSAAIETTGDAFGD